MESLTLAHESWVGSCLLTVKIGKTLSTVHSGPEAWNYLKDWVSYRLFIIARTFTLGMRMGTWHQEDRARFWRVRSLGFFPGETCSELCVCVCPSVCVPSTSYYLYFFTYKIEVLTVLTWWDLMEAINWIKSHKVVGKKCQTQSEVSAKC